jgi:enoyl-CoA hydratase
VTEKPEEAMTEREPVEIERRGVSQVITINRPDARNAVDAAVAQGIATALDELEADDGLRVGVLTGAGGHFSAGMDLKAFLRGEAPFAGDRGFAGIVQRPPAKPVIAAVEGSALAGGFEIALACDLIVASTGARFGIPEVKRSLVAAGGALFRLPRRIPYHLAMEMALTGEPVGATRAYDLGLVNRVCANGSACEVAVELADAVAANGPLALAASKQIVANAADWTETEAWQRQGEIVGPVFGSEDAQEGARAFAEKRPPVWSGR